MVKTINHYTVKRSSKSIYEISFVHGEMECAKKVSKELLGYVCT